MQTAKVLHGKDWTATNNGRGSTVTLPEKLLPPFWARWFTWEDLIVAGRQVKGFVVSPTIAAVVLGAMLSAIGVVYWRMSDRVDTQNKLLYDQKELIIRLDQRLIDKNERDKEKKEELEKRLQNMDALDIAQGRDIATLKGQKGNGQ